MKGSEMKTPKESSERDQNGSFTQYCSASMIHGIQYIGGSGKSTIDKLLWTVILTASISMAAYMITEAYDKWTTSPIIVSFHEEATPVWKIPFPAVTICPSTKIKQSVFNVTKFLEDREEHDANSSTSEVLYFEKLNTLCHRKYDYYELNTTSMDIVDTFEEVAPSLEETVLFCLWGGLEDDCAGNFSRTLTEDGICYTFNMLDPEDFFTEEVALNDEHGFVGLGTRTKGWSLEGGYPKGSGMITYPRRALGAGLKLGLTMLLISDIKEKDDYCSLLNGYKIVLHQPALLPVLTDKFIRVPYNQEVSVSIKMEIMTTSPELRSYSYEKRYCYFGDERRLRFYKTYTQPNCEMECLSNFTLKMCECVGYYMPHERNVSICGSGKTECLREAEREFLKQEIENEILYDDVQDENIDTCDCYPSCTAIYYNGEITQTDISTEKLYEDGETKRVSKVNIIIAEDQFIGSRRSELYGTMDFLANCGGLLGLFMGFSILAFVEIVYHLLLGLGRKIHKFRVKNRRTSGRVEPEITKF